MADKGEESKGSKGRHRKKPILNARFQGHKHQRMADIRAMGKTLPQRAPSRDPLRDWFPTAKISEGRWSLLLRARPSSAPLSDPASFALRMLRAPSRPGSFAHERLAQELAVSHAVRHPALLPVVDGELHGAHPFTVTPYINGYSLEKWVQSPLRMPLGLASWLTRQIAEALGAMHAAGFRHGNVQAANILCDADGQAVLIGLGSAMSIGALARGEELAVNPAYAAPEQFRPGSEAQSGSDIYSLGAMLFELLAKRPPFLAGNAEEFAAMHQLAPIPDLRSLVPDAPFYLAALLRRMLAKDPLRRPEAEEVAKLLSDFEITSFRDWVAA
jgi:eukaryotic-like serine/threonine-protein kinase